MHMGGAFIGRVLFMHSIFTFSTLFSKKPLFTLIMSICSTIIFTIKFNVPLKVKHVSSHFDWLIDVYYHSFLKELFNVKKSRLHI